MVETIGHRARRHEDHHKRDLVVVTKEVDVYVDQNGNVIDYEPTQAPAPIVVSTPVYVQPTSTPAPYVAPTTSAAPPPPAKTKSTPPPAASSSSSTPSGAIFGKALVYSPYHNDGTCKDAADVSTDLNHIIGTTKNYAGVRLYGTDCNQVANVLPVARTLGIKVMLGVYDITQAQAEANTIVSAVGGNWDVVHSVGCGNEEVNKAILAGKSGDEAVAASLAAAAIVRSTVSAAGFTGQVVTPEVFMRITQFPAICGSSSFVAANAHPFFDGGVTAEQAGTWYSEQIANLEKACNKPVLITETGWPTQGTANGVAVPSEANQATVISSACSSLKDDFVTLSAYNDLWKKNFDGSFGAEQVSF